MIELWTTQEQELEMQKEFEEKISQKQLEIDAEVARTGKLQKYMAKAFFSDPERVFFCVDGQWNLKISSVSSLVTQQTNTGRCYVIGPISLPEEAERGLMEGKFAAVFRNTPGMHGPSHGHFYCTIVDRRTNSLILQLVSDDDLYDF